MWDYPWGSIAYDIKVGAILAFIFLTPPAVFQDRPQIDKARDEIVMLPGSSSESRFWLEQSLIGEISESQRFEELSRLISERTGKVRRVVHVEPVESSEGGFSGYVATTRP